MHMYAVCTFENLTAKKSTFRTFVDHGRVITTTTAFQFAVREKQRRK